MWKMFQVHNDDPMLKYRQNLFNSYCSSSLVSAFASIKQTKDANAISFRIEESSKNKMGNRIDFANGIMKNVTKLKCEPRIYYSQRRYKRMGSYDILTDISEQVTLVQLINSLVNVNHAISVVG